MYDNKVNDNEEEIFAASCFWGVEHYFKQFEGVLKTEVGYSGGRSSYPSYTEICAGASGHYEVIRVLFDPARTSYENIAKYFFEIHDPTQENGQGPDLGEQYLSVAFYYNDAQKRILLQLIHTLKNAGIDVATKVLPVTVFWRAEKYHQSYYEKNGQQPYCHRYTKRF